MLNIITIGLDTNYNNLQGSSPHVLYLGFTQVIWTHGIAVWQIRYIGFRQVIRAHITCLSCIFRLRKYKTQTGYMSPYYLSKAYITNSTKELNTACTLIMRSLKYMNVSEIEHHGFVKLELFFLAQNTQNCCKILWRNRKSKVKNK